MLAIGACSAPAPPTFDLSAPRDFGRAAALGGGQLAVSEPLTVQVFDSERIIVKSSSGEVSYLSGAQWADRLPKLVQTRLIQAFENGSRLGRVGRPGDGVIADYTLGTEIRRFEVESGTGEAVVEITARLIGATTGRVASARIFVARAPVAHIDGPEAARALDEALSSVLVQIVRWMPSRVPGAGNS
ncbi:ABC-type transport auxiliary lipoprotein family protein [Chelatococcus sp. SYSU_G07232]|uniref:ABC-type transport auxiliary lipoprotein family protein n=2 Tax=Chelatococcus albus TaxID=3047466 RepID=A0ABT7AGK6_9HYPH|nr:ABC-type transport auxiliary lipoprotein family protein [Chelatococcus sp. SYSU_G07232]MDJ1158496.1 ABC-type transport auxiliary lipoprotein family protein [Chelatococcus sp. SYSU_G07232]